MARATPSTTALPAIVADQILTLGTNLALARKRRRMSRREMAQRMLVNPKTVERMERGDPSVGVGIVATALWVLGMHRKLVELVNPETDRIGLQEDLRRLPNRIRARRVDVDELDF